MGIAASELCQHVIRPTLVYLGRHSPTAEALLLGAAASQSALGSALDDCHGHGLYRISALRHEQLWDQHLARDPDLASLVRGLASQHAFLAAPHLELTVNLRYATAIAWLLVESEHRRCRPPTTCTAWPESGARCSIRTAACATSCRPGSSASHNPTRRLEGGKVEPLR